jgi:hypothetical protein
VRRARIGTTASASRIAVAIAITDAIITATAEQPRRASVLPVGIGPSSGTDLGCA